MDTLLTEIISFSGTAKGIPARERDRSCKYYFIMLRISYRGCRTNLHHGGTETRRKAKAEKSLALASKCLHIDSRILPSFTVKFAMRAIHEVFGLDRVSSSARLGSHTLAPR